MTTLLLLVILLGVLLGIPRSRHAIKNHLLAIGIAGYVIFALIMSLLPLGVVCLIGWVLWHFISKAW